MDGVIPSSQWVTLNDGPASDTLPSSGKAHKILQQVRNFLKWVKEKFVELKDYIDGAKQPKIIAAACPTAAATAAKAVTIGGYTLTAGDIFTITFAYGNTAASATININGAGAKAVSLGGGAPTGASGTGAHYVASGRTALYYYNGTYMCLMGSQDITDADTTTASLTDAAESSGLPSTTANTAVASLLQTIRNNLKHLFANKADNSQSAAADFNAAELGTAAVTDTVPGWFQRIRRGLTWIKNWVNNNFVYRSHGHSLNKPAAPCCPISFTLSSRAAPSAAVCPHLTKSRFPNWRY